MVVRILILINIILSFLLINLGGLVHNTGSSLACPDWPLCYGQIMPVMEGGVLIEHSHRMLATLVGFLSILILIFAYRQFRSVKRIIKYSWVALIMVILQGVLGGITVILKLPTIVSTSHLGLSMIFISTLVYLHHLVASETKKVDPLNTELKEKWNFNIKPLVMLGTVLVYFQILLGALMRHLGLGGACGVGKENVLRCNDVIGDVIAWIPASSEAQLHSLHRYSAIAISIFITAIFIFSVRKIFKFKRKYKDVARLSSYLTSVSHVIILQMLLGFATIMTNLGVHVTTAHLGGATLLLMLLWKSYLLLGSIEKEMEIEKRYSFVTDIFELAKPRLSGLVVFTAALGLYLAPGEISFYKGLLAILTTSLIVAGACAINCVVEKDLDKLMKRTQDRAVAAGRLDPKLALKIGVTITVISILLQFLFVNTLTGILGALAGFIYIFVYTPLKKRSTTFVLVGAIPGAIPPLMGWVSVTGSIDSFALALFAILFVWQLPHFLAISIFYADDYANATFKVTPNVQGINFTKVNITLLTAILTLLNLSFLNLGINNPMFYKISIGLGALFTVYAARGHFIGEDKEKNRQWARNYFLGSLLYLPSNFILILIYN
jgi:protoheme IX farnesyltransferase